jgi:3-deoxy-D-manno-octulosonate 8-phosphate phosphatase (KDO 8-P phosphatase)
MKLEKLKKIKLIAVDIDGTLTDGSLYQSATEEFKRFNVQDGAGIVLAVRSGVPVAFISGRESACVRRRAKEILVEDVHLGIHDKVAVLNGLVEKYDITMENVLFIGDDLNDLPALAAAGLSAAPADGVQDVIERVDFVTKRMGGKGAIREMIELVMKSQGKWAQIIEGLGGGNFSQ